MKLSAGALGGASAVGIAAQPANAAIGPVVDTVRRQIVRAGREVASVCPYCSVGCGQIVTVARVNGVEKIVSIDGNANSPINEGTLCPKGAATFQLAVNENRWTGARIRRPGSDRWEDITLDQAMERTTQLFKQTRDETFVEKRTVSGAERTVNHTTSIFSLGGATIDDEWNYLHQKLMRAAGLVSIENQARI